LLAHGSISKSRRASRSTALARTLQDLAPLSLSALLLTLVLLFGLQGEQIIRQPTVILLLAVPIVIQVYLNAGIAYWLNRALGVEWCAAGPSARSRSSRVATVIALGVRGVSETDCCRQGGNVGAGQYCASRSPGVDSKLPGPHVGGEFFNFAAWGVAAMNKVMVAGRIVAVATLFLGPTVLVSAQTQQPTREDNIWGGKAHQPTQSDVNQQEKASGIAPPTQDQQRANDEVENLYQKLIQPGASAP
jgi:hypothetical protein